MPGRLLNARTTAEHRAHTREQLGHTEGFDQVIVGAKLARADAVNGSTVRRHDQDGHLRVAAEGSQHGQPIWSGQADIQQQQIKAMLRCQLQGLRTIRGGQHLKAGRAEVVRDELTHWRFVIDDQNAKHDYRASAALTSPSVVSRPDLAPSKRWAAWIPPVNARRSRLVGDAQVVCCGRPIREVHARVEAQFRARAIEVRAHRCQAEHELFRDLASRAAFGEQT